MVGGRYRSHCGATANRLITSKAPAAFVGANGHSTAQFGVDAGRFEDVGEIEHIRITSRRLPAVPPARTKPAPPEPTRSLVPGIEEP